MVKRVATATERATATTRQTTRTSTITKSANAGAIAAAHLIAADSRFAPLVAAHGPLSLHGVKTQPSSFAALLKSIVYQQLAGKAAATIHGRVITALKADPPTPEAVLATPYDDLRGAGLSERKVAYVVDLANHFADGRLSEDVLQSASDDKVMEALTAVKGIGPWTCQSFMIFQLCRPDVLPAGDFCVQKGVKKLFDFDEKKKLTPSEMESLSHAWSPFRSYASYYLWLDAKNKTPGSSGSNK